MDAPHQTQQVMQCMEVWGGNQAVDTAVVLAGLDAWVYSRPYHDAASGGDVHYVSSCATGRINRLLLADVSGHGAAVGDVAVGLRGLMRRYVNYIDQTHFVGQINRRFAELSQDGCFATAVVNTFFAPTNELTICNAGHPAPLLYRAAERCWSLLRLETEGGAVGGVAACDHDPGASANIPLGIEDRTEYEQFVVRLDVGDLVLCYTDSLTESCGVDGELLGEAGLLAVARTLDVADPTAVVPALMARVAALAPGNLVGDDVTVLLFRPNGRAASVPLRDRLLAPLRVCRAAVAALRSGDPMPWPELSIANIGGAMISRLGRRGRTTLPPPPLSSAPPPASPPSSPPAVR